MTSFCYLKKFHNMENKKRCVLITQHPGLLPPSLSHHLHDISYTASETNTHHILSLQLWTVLPKNPRALTKHSHAFQNEPIAASQTGLKTNQTAKQHCKHSLPLSGQPPPLSKNGSPHPRTECSSMGGSRRHKCVVYFCANVTVCAWARGE